MIVSRTAAGRAAAARMVAVSARVGGAGLRAGRRWFRPVRLRRLFLGFATVLALLASPVVGGVVAAFEYINLPAHVPLRQASVLYYSDGVTELARVGVQDRTLVKLDAVPMSLRHAVLAAEDRTFYEHGALSWKGVGRALVSNVTSDDSTQGASTITQQFVKNTYLRPERTMQRKVEEAVLSLKAERRFSKDEILEGYLNTIYFGRGAYGVAAAAQIYFGKKVNELTPEEGAVLATSIKSPTGYDPVVNRIHAEPRWRYLLESMAEQGWLTNAQVKAAKYPAIAPEQSTLTGPKGYIVAQIERELRAHGITEQQLRTKGLRIVTTIDRTAQAAAEKAMTRALAAAAADTRGALVSVQPKTGAIRAYVGGNKGYGFLDYARGSYPSGGTLRPFVVVGKWFGIDGPRRPRTDELRAARDLALAAGIRKATAGEREIAHHDRHESASSILARYPVTPTALAESMGTVAADGVRATPHALDVVSEGDQVLFRQQPIGRRVGGPLGAPKVTLSIRSVLDWAAQLPGKRWSAGTSGSRDFGPSKQRTVSTAWASGFTFELATVVWLGHDKTAPLRTRSGGALNGEATAARIWSSYVGEALADAPQSSPPELASVALRTNSSLPQAYPSRWPSRSA